METDRERSSRHGINPDECEFCDGPGVDKEEGTRQAIRAQERAAQEVLDWRDRAVGAPPAPTPGQVAVIEGTVRYHYSERDDCVCCVGPHVYGYRLERDDGERSDVPSSGWVFRALRSVPDGTRLRFSAQVVGASEQADTLDVDAATAIRNLLTLNWPGATIGSDGPIIDHALETLARLGSTPSRSGEPG